MNIHNTNSRTDLINKVPQVTLFFWIIKVLCTTVGETFADFLNVNLNFGLTTTSVVMGILLVIALFFQFRAKKYIPVVYWVTVVFISVFGTLVTDNLTDKMGVPLETSTIVFSILLLLTFILWYAKEKTLSIHSIYTKRREAFYWLTILFTFALGTAAGDLLAEGLGLGYFVTGIIVTVVIVCVIIARFLKLNSVLSFWIIYIMTRPLGASIGDLLSQPSKFGGLGFGATLTSAIFLLAILGIILYFTFSKRDEIKDITNEVRNEEESKGLIWQAAITVALFIIVGTSAYYWRQNSLNNEISKPVVNVSSQKNNSTVENGPVDTKVQLSALGDLSEFIKITEDTKNFISANNLSGAKDRVGDLEYEWDNAQAKLKPMNGAKWTKVDDAIDRVLRDVRAVNPVPQKCTTSLTALLEVLK